MKWRIPTTTNSISTLVMHPRIAIIYGADSLGNSYITLTQANTNSSIIVLYLKHLAQKLDIERPNWRKNTIILADGASYH